MEHQFENQQEQERAVSELSQRQDLRNAGERGETALALERMGTESVESRMSRLRQALRKRRHCLRLARIGIGLSLTAGMATLFRPLPLGVVDSVFHTEVLLVLFGYGMMFRNLVRGEKPLQEAAGALANDEDLPAVGLLVEAAQLGNPTHTIAVSALSRLLPRLQASDAGLLDEGQRAGLYRVLEQCANPRLFWRYNPHFAAVLLRALEQIGDHRALPVVERLARSRAKTPAQKRLQNAARVCLPSLRLRAAGRRDDETLLRPGMDLTLSGNGQTLDGTSSQTPTEAEETETLMAQLKEAVRQRTKTDRLLGMAASAGALTAVLNLFLMLDRDGSGPPFPSLGYTAIGCLALTLLLAFHGIYRMIQIASALVNTDDLRIVGPLTEMAVVQSGGGASAMASYLLTRLLPRLQASDADRLNETQRACLSRSLTTVTNNPDYLVAVLKALEQIGDPAALPVVERLADGRQRTAAPERVQAAARECLPYLQLRADQARASQTLLRASSASVTPPEVLLRPAQGSDGAGPEQLLRPGTPRVESEEEPVRLQVRPPSPIAAAG